MGRLAAVIAVGAFALAPISPDTSSAGATSQVEPPQCPPDKKPVVITAGTTPDGGPLYLRAYGRAHATLKVGGQTYRIKGGFCQLKKITSLENGDVTWMLSVFTGFVSNLPTPVGQAVLLQIEAGHRVRAGQKLTVFDSVIETPGSQYAAQGETILRPHLDGGSFTIVDHADHAGTTISGRWRCR